MLAVQAVLGEYSFSACSSTLENLFIVLLTPKEWILFGRKTSSILPPRHTRRERDSMVDAGHTNRIPILLRIL